MIVSFTRRHIVRSAFAVTTLLLSLTVVSGQAPAAGAQRADRGLFWQFEREGRTGWLVGSLHLLTRDFYPLPAAMTDAFTLADVLVEEIDMAEASSPAFAATILSKAMYPTGTTLASQISPETYKALSAWVGTVGIPMSAMEQLKPWMVSLTLQTIALQKMGLDPEFGIDKHFSDAAGKAGKPLLALETAAEQIDFLDRLSPRTQDLMLRESMESIEKELAEIKALVNAWRTGNVSAVERVALESLKDAPEVYQSLLADRNRRWMPAIEKCVQTRRCFIVVGAAHLVGPDGLVALLKRQGYRVEQR
jgi:uncharacterized protein YbaP (TraB family)